MTDTNPPPLSSHIRTLASLSAKGSEQQAALLAAFDLLRAREASGFVPAVPGDLAGWAILSPDGRTITLAKTLAERDRLLGPRDGWTSLPLVVADGSLLGDDRPLPAPLCGRSDEWYGLLERLTAMEDDSRLGVSCSLLRAMVHTITGGSAPCCN